MRRALPLVATLSLAGCGALDDAMASAQLALDGTQAATALSQSAYLGGVVFASVSSQDPAVAAKKAVLPDDLSPRGCAKWASAPAGARAATVSFDGCGGAFELSDVTGALLADFGEEPDGRLRAAIASREFFTGNKPANLSAVALVKIDEGSRAVDWQATWTARTAAGLGVTQTAAMVLVVDAATNCRTFSGKVDTVVDGRALETTTDGFRICTDSAGATVCPDGVLVHRDGATGTEVTVRFDGGEQVFVSSPGNDSYVVALRCAPPGVSR